MHDTAIGNPIVLGLRGAFALMRPRQWIKNGFVFAPLVFTGEFLVKASVQHALLATFLFCVASSATYIVNDIRDIENDRRHPKKSRTRPLAAGIISVPVALLLLLVLYAVLIAGWFVMPKVMLIIIGYLALNVAYTFVLKHQPVLDIFTIAAGFVLRVYAGAMALAVPVSGWMFVTTLCLALYLAAVKRRQELSQNGSEGRRVLQKYSVVLLDRYAEMSATGALVFYGMFVMSERPEMVVTIPLVLFGLFRYWFVVEELDGGESPADALLADWQLLATVLLWLAACVWALWPAKG
ncbi:decaprenyl-phosphate phosphoribosyltransferase [Noviherbaspirillum sp. CPCC 100848]|uniref:Decaprenyl-phosphate phosphoribosyltransferase n=1 Tax=Noviherbaspirillum album TaxID=3080276 RepID=A0ABU6JHK9_9BURK|nr:decaprenyl-phosphate phosphoribosyltransferase [Noviherbaspirillum sp. CPCC 100848]MEC4722913.1 decaprenyl-phosphate phosphoribosyltransferase [Noviherbaspirillum sp. CPCC 100848]